MTRTTRLGLSEGRFMECRLWSQTLSEGQAGGVYNLSCCSVRLLNWNNGRRWGAMGERRSLAPRLKRHPWQPVVEQRPPASPGRNCRGLRKEGLERTLPREPSGKHSTKPIQSGRLRVILGRLKCAILSLLFLSPPLYTHPSLPTLPPTITSPPSLILKTN